MLRARIIPCLLIHQRGLVKSQKFSNHIYVGDPLNAVKIFNEKSVDELMVLDIDATVEGREPDYRTIEALARECRMPLCYGGGITRADQVARIIDLGVEKCAVSAAAVKRPELVAEIAAKVGRQSAVVVVDVKRTLFGGYTVYTHNARTKARVDLIEFCKAVEAHGAGEVVINSIDRDGTMNGYDMQLVQMVRDAVSVPLTVLGGAGNLQHLSDLVARYPIIGAAAGSLFVFKGSYRAVLINYPAQEEVVRMCAR